MDKTIFVNSEIFKKDADYIIGGFHTDKEEGFTYADFRSEFKERAETLLNEFIEKTCSVYALNKIEDVFEEAKMSAARIIYDNLKIIPESSATSDLLEAIIDSDYAQKWLFDINFNINNIEYTNQRVREIGTNNLAGMMNKDSKEYLEKKSLVEDSDFAIFIEQLSMIET